MRKVYGVMDESKFEKFRKKPVTIEAYKTDTTVSIETLEGVMVAKPGDWIIKGVEGEVYPCKDSVFQKTYDKVKEDLNEA